jgi:hypothetical protein
VPLVHPARLPLAGRGVGASVGRLRLVLGWDLLAIGILPSLSPPTFHRTEPVRDQAIHGIVIPFKAGRDDLLRELAA